MSLCFKDASSRQPSLTIPSQRTPLLVLVSALFLIIAPLDSSYMYLLPACRPHLSVNSTRAEILVRFTAGSPDPIIVPGTSRCLINICRLNEWMDVRSGGGDLGNVCDASLAEPMHVVYVLVACLSVWGCVSLCLPSMSQTPGCSSSGCDNGGLRCGCASECGFTDMAVCVCARVALGVCPGTTGCVQLCVWPAVHVSLSGSGWR